jgi:hypothetical protein
VPLLDLELPACVARVELRASSGPGHRHLPSKGVWHGVKPMSKTCVRTLADGSGLKIVILLYFKACVKSVGVQILLFAAFAGH